MISRVAGERASEPNAPGREVSVRLNIAACHDRRLFVASEKGINDTPARDALSHTPSRVRARAPKHGIHYNELFAPRRPFFERRIVSLVRFEECPRRRIILRMRRLQTTVDKLYGRAVRLVSYEPLYAVSPCEGSRLFVCISERFAAHTLL